MALAVNKLNAAKPSGPGVTVDCTVGLHGAHCIGFTMKSWLQLALFEYFVDQRGFDKHNLAVASKARHHKTNNLPQTAAPRGQHPYVRALRSVGFCSHERITVKI